MLLTKEKRICFKYDSRYGEKHLRSVILLELVVQFLVSAVLSIVGGYLFGQLLFMSINKIIGIKQPNLSDYPFDSLAMIITLSLLLALMFYYSL